MIMILILILMRLILLLIVILLLLLAGITNGHATMCDVVVAFRTYDSHYTSKNNNEPMGQLRDAHSHTHFGD